LRLTTPIAGSSGRATPTVFAAGLIWGVTLIGCGRDTAVPPAKPATPQPPVSDTTANEPKPQAAMTESVTALPAPATADQTPQPNATGAAEPTTEKQTADDPNLRERIAVLTAGGPLLIDVWLNMDGRPHSELFAERIQQVLDAGDANSDHKSTWRKLAANEEFLKAERATNPNTPESRAKAWIERFDLNRDKQIQASEAAAWLGRDAGRSAAALALRSRRSYHSLPALASRVWQLLDTDNNRRLSSDEISAAPDKFLSLDANDDRIITTPELAPLRDQLNDAGRPMTNSSSYEIRHAALHLESHADVDQLDYLLADLYSPRRSLGPGSFPGLPRLFDELDANDDHQMSRDELAGLLTTAPHLELAVAFEKPESGGRGEARLNVRKHESEVTVLAQPAANRIALSLGNIRINVSAHDLAIPEPADQPAERSEIRAMVHDDCDALFEALDRNADGRLGERELTTSSARMRELDTNGDGQLANEELPTAMIVAFLRSERPAEQSFYVPDAPATPRSNDDAPAWFAHADFNSDGDVSRREFLGSIEQFTRLDANQDGFIAAEEAAATTASQ
jgi:Ca2+-binding EF-hand superfamily protein